MYSVFCAIAIFYVVFVVPETKGRDLESIAKLFVKNDCLPKQKNDDCESKNTPAIRDITNSSEMTKL